MPSCRPQPLFKTAIGWCRAAAPPVHNRSRSSAATRCSAARSLGKDLRRRHSHTFAPGRRIEGQSWKARQPPLPPGARPTRGLPGGSQSRKKCPMTAAARTGGPGGTEPAARSPRDHRRVRREAVLTAGQHDLKASPARYDLRPCRSATPLPRAPTGQSGHASRASGGLLPTGKEGLPAAPRRPAALADWGR